VSGNCARVPCMIVGIPQEILNSMLSNMSINTIIYYSISLKCFRINQNQNKFVSILVCVCVCACVCCEVCGDVHVYAHTRTHSRTHSDVSIGSGSECVPGPIKSLQQAGCQPIRFRHDWQCSAEKTKHASVCSVL
jgi:hypothetical protein